MRREFPNKIKRDAAARANGHCEQCRMKLRSGEFHFDHVIPDWMGGEPELHNCEVLCVVCHRSKTKKDVGDIAKSKRIIDRNRGIKRAGRKLPGSRDSRIKKKVSGEVVDRLTGQPINHWRG